MEVLYALGFLWGILINDVWAAGLALTVVALILVTAYIEEVHPRLRRWREYRASAQTPHIDRPRSI